MKNRIKNKLRSRAGASITFALLLFLVCSVLCSVVLTAATSASGRMSQIAEADQRYYAVTSAAELLKSIIDGKTASIVTVTETEYTTTYNAGVAGASETGTPTITTYIIPDKRAEEITKADYKPENQVDGTGFKLDTFTEDAAYHINTGALNTRDLSLETKIYSDGKSGLDYDALAVTIKETIGEDGSLTLTLYNRYKAKDTDSSLGDQYRLTVVFGADVSETTDSTTENKSSTAKSTTEYEVTTIKTETAIKSLTWHLSEIKTNSGGAESNG